jgi:hypothetical protein
MVLNLPLTAARIPVVFALIVSADGHRKAESDDEGEQCQGTGHDKIEILMRVLFQIKLPLTKEETDPRRQHIKKKERAITMSGCLIKLTMR